MFAMSYEEIDEELLDWTMTMIEKGQLSIHTHFYCVIHTKELLILQILYCRQLFFNAFLRIQSLCYCLIIRICT